jgi:hypothetical protein
MNFLKWVTDISLGWIPYVPKATWNLIRFDLTGSKPYRIRLVIFYLGLVFMGLGYLVHGDGYSDASTICPPYTQLQRDSGMLDEWKNGRMYVWRLKRPDGTQITFHQEYTIGRVLNGKFEYDKNGYDTPKPAIIKWFKLPSNSKWISELTLDGKKLVSYDQRCKDLKEFGKHNEKLLIDDFIFLAIALFMIVLEARSLKNNYIKGE